MDDSAAIVHAAPVESSEILDLASSFELFVDAETVGFHSALRLLARDRAEAEDLMQDAFLKVWERWEHVRSLDDPSGYLYRTAMNLHRKRLRRAAVAIRHAIAIGVGWLGVNAIRSAPSPADRPTPSPGILRTNGEVLTFTGDPSWSHRAPGDLVAVNPDTGQERVLVEDLEVVYSAEWSADGRWVAYATEAPEGDLALWVVGASQEPRLVVTGGAPDIFAASGLYWLWSPTGAELATISRSTLSTIDFATGETTDLGSIVADLLDENVNPHWAWSPDRTRIVFGAPRGVVYTVDVWSGERSLLVRLPGLPGEEFDTVSEVLWSPDGAHIAVVNGPRLYVMDTDGSNVRVLDDDYDGLGVAWSPDGTRLAFADGSAAQMVRILVAPMDGSAPAETVLPIAGCAFYNCEMTWSPDWSRIAFHTRHRAFVIDADGRSEAEPIDELAYRSWDGGWYFGNEWP
jgi:dipeptidyl aminopeptidase/acylaminoacyl peptidase